MKTRFSFVAVTILLGLALWWTLSRLSGTSPPPPTVTPALGVAARDRSESAQAAAASAPESVVVKMYGTG